MSEFISKKARKLTLDLIISLPGNKRSAEAAFILAEKLLKAESRVAELEAENQRLRERIGNERLIAHIDGLIDGAAAFRPEEFERIEAENKRLRAPVSSGVVLITAERQRQIDVEGWTPEHDDEHSSSELNRAARFYAKKAQYPESYTDVKAPMGWPWDTEWWKPSPDPIRNLVKAGALIAAEIDRLQRLAARAKPAEGEDGKPKIK